MFDFGWVFQQAGGMVRTVGGGEMGGLYEGMGKGDGERRWGKGRWYGKFVVFSSF